MHVLAKYKVDALITALYISYSEGQNGHMVPLHCSTVRVIAAILST